MTNANLVLVDTGIWSAFFSKPASVEKRALDVLLDEDRVALTGPILAEVLRGFRRTDQADWVASRLRLAHYIEPTWEDWRNAAALGRELDEPSQFGEEIWSRANRTPTYRHTSFLPVISCSTAWIG